MLVLGEIKRRKIFQVAAVYAVVAWLLIQIVATVEAPLRLPDWADTLVILLLAIGFPVALVISWAFNLTPEGLVREGDGGAPVSGHRSKIEHVLFGVLALAVGFLFVDTYVLDEQDEAVAVTTTSSGTEGAAENAATLSIQDVLPNSIAVLPFENLSPDPDNAYFAAGIHESTLNQLGKISDLIVIASTSVMQYAKDPPPIPEIAKALHVEAVMVGSVRYANGRVLITPQLIDGRTGGHLWSEEFNRELTDVFAIQAEVAKQIATAMQVQVLTEEHARIENRPTESTEAYQHYLHALSFPNPQLYPEYFPAIIESLERAIAADPDFAEAVANMAMTYYLVGNREKAIETAKKAIELDPTVSLAYWALGLSYENYYVHQDEARAAYKRAMELSPNDPDILTGYSYNLVKQSGDYADAIRIGKRAVGIDPTSAFAHGRLGFAYMRAGELAAASRHMREAIRLDPGIYELYLNLGFAEYLSGNTRAAKQNLNHAVSIMPPRATYRVDYLVYLYGLLGESEQAEQQLARLEKLISDRGSESWPPLTWAALGIRDKERALLELAITVDGYLREGRPVAAGRIGRFRDNWLNDPMLEEPEFLELRRRLGFKG